MEGMSFPSVNELRVTPVVFGAWPIGGWMWGGADRRNAVDAVRASIDAGVTSIDTAPIYGQGLSEEIVGEAIHGLNRSELQILTKCGLRWDTERGEFFFESEGNDGRTVRTYRHAGHDSVIGECEASLRRLGTDYIDLYQVHWPDPTTPIHETMEALGTLADQGKVRAVGVSNFSVEQMREAEETLGIVSNQVGYSMVNRGIEKELIPYCSEQRRAILAYSPLQGGLLTGKFSPERKFEATDHRGQSAYYKPENIRRVNAFLETLRPIAEDHNATMAQIVIAWTLVQPGITAALVGARDSRQALANARAVDVHLDQAELDRIDANLADLNARRLLSDSLRGLETLRDGAENFPIFRFR